MRLKLECRYFVLVNKTHKQATTEMVGNRSTLTRISRKILLQIAIVERIVSTRNIPQSAGTTNGLEWYAIVR